MPCKCYGVRHWKGTVQLRWTSSFTVISPSEIKKSVGFYQFSSRGSYYSLIKGRSSSDRLWKTKFFIISGDWVGDPVDVNSAPFPRFTSPFFFFILLLLLIRLVLPSFFCIGATVIRPRLDRFYLNRIDQVCFFSDRSFHGLVTFSRLAAWGLGPIPTAKNLGHEETTRRSKCRPLPSFSFSLF